jgi:hypothetical protein
VNPDDATRSVAPENELVAEGSQSHAPVACTLLPDQLNTRRAELLPGLAARAKSCARIADGYQLKFEATGDVLHAIASVIAAERLCCRFLGFQVTVEPDDGPIRLDVSGPAGTTQLLGDLLDRG